MNKHRAKARSYRAWLKSRWRDTRASMEARALWTLIETYANTDGSNAHPSVDTLVSVSGHRTAWVRKYLAELVLIEWLRIEKKATSTGWVNCYRIFYPGSIVDRGDLPPPNERNPRGWIAPPEEEHKGSFEQWITGEG